MRDAATGCGHASRPVCGAAVLALLAAMTAMGCGGSSKPASTSAPSTRAATAPSTATTEQPGTATASGPRVVRATGGEVEAEMRAGTHTPTVNAAWPVHFRVRRAGRAARASVRYEYLFQGQVVARRSHFTFHGRFSDIFRWPAAAVGYPLTFRAVIESGGTTVNLDYTVQVHR